MIIIETPNFTIHAIDGYIETLYLVVYSDKLLLLDGGCRCDAKDVVDYIQRLNDPMEELKPIVVTTLTLIIPSRSNSSSSIWCGDRSHANHQRVVHLGINGWFTQKTDIF